MLMHAPCVAAFLTECGPLQIYDVLALRGVVEALPRSNWGTCDATFLSENHGPPDTARHDVASIGPSALASKRGQSRSVGEGWGLEQWRCWDRTKIFLGVKHLQAEWCFEGSYRRFGNPD